MLLAFFLFTLCAGYTFALGNDASSSFDYAAAMSMVVFFFIFFATVVWKVSLFHEKLKKDHDDFYDE
jgi:ABC-type sugar transport system permease subunit